MTAAEEEDGSTDASHSESTASYQSEADESDFDRFAALTDRFIHAVELVAAALLAGLFVIGFIHTGLLLLIIFGLVALLFAELSSQPNPAVE